MKTFGEVDAECVARLKLKPGESGVWGESQRMRILNIAQRRFVKLTGVLTETFTTTSVTATSAYAYSTFDSTERIIKPEEDEGVSFDDGTTTWRVPYKSLRWFDKNMVGWRDDDVDSTPSYYAIRQRKYIVFSCPTTASKTISLSAIIKPDPVTAADTEFFNGEEWIMEDYDEALVEYFLWKAYKQQGLAYDGKSLEAKQNFIDYVRQCKKDIKDLPDAVNNVRPMVYRSR